MIPPESPAEILPEPGPAVTSDFFDAGVLDSTLDGGIGARAAIGLLVLASDQTMEHEFRRLVPGDGIGLYVTRVWNDLLITPETLRRMRDLIAPATRLLLPGMPLDVVAFGCTSATMAMGEETIFAEIARERPEVRCTTPITAALAAFEALEARRIAVLTPYGADVNAMMRTYLEGRGVTVVGFGTFDKPDDRDAARVSLDSIRAAAELLVARSGADAVFISCTSLRLSERVAEIEAAVGVPVTSSDHSLAWHCLRLAGIEEPIAGAGRLFTL